MVGLRVGNQDSQTVFIVGHGITLNERFELAEGVVIDPAIPEFTMEDAAATCERFSDYSAVVLGRELANFSLRVQGVVPARELAIKSWNALWDFHLLSLAAQAPVFSLFSVATGTKPIFSAAHRVSDFRHSPEPKPIETKQLDWVRANKNRFDQLIHHPSFNAAMRCYGNAHHLPDPDMRLMLIWSGIEGLLSVDGELNRRIALYCSLMLDGSHEDKLAIFQSTKKAYAVRSKAVHGGGASREVLQNGYRDASVLLARLLSKCVELGRVPTSSEMDALAVTLTVT